MNTHIQIMKIFSFSSFSLSADLRLSVILEGYSSRTGIEMESSFSSSTMIDGKLEINQNNVVKIDFNLPQDKLDIFQTS